MTGKANGATPPGHANGKHRGSASQETHAAVMAAPLVDDETFDLSRGFEMRADSLYRRENEKAPAVRICGPIEVVAEGRSEHGEDWSLLLRWQDRDGRRHEWFMPRRMLVDEAAEVRARLASCGLDVSAHPHQRNLLGQFLVAVHVATRVRTVSRTG